MPISQINSGLITQPGFATQNREVRARQQSPADSEQLIERDTNPGSRDSAVEIIQATDDIERILSASQTAESVFRNSDLFTRLPTSAREALDSYLTTQQASLNNQRGDGSDVRISH